jgi:two-component system, NtrC family, response regulator AtoC
MKEPHFLIIDDERDFREFLSEALEAEGYGVAHAGTARAGLALARDQSPRIVLLDQNLPDGSGLDLIPELRRLPSNPVVIVITAYAEYDRAVRAVKTGAYHYLAKPFAFSDLLAVVRDACVAFSIDDPAGSAELAALIATDPRMLELKQCVARIAAMPVSTVLVRGESGTGKELVAQAIHRVSDRASQRMVCVNCAALTETLLMDELFGHEQGAFTDARARKQGVFELANRGTLFLDEIGEMGARAQAALLRVLEQRRVTRVGGTDEIPIDVRIITATNRDLERHVTEGHFRADLYYRLNVVDIWIPPLRERRGDIMVLARHFGRAVAARYGEPERAFTPATEALLTAYDWPGNVRELHNVVERTYAMSSRAVIDVGDLPAEVQTEAIRLQGTVHTSDYQRPNVAPESTASGRKASHAAGTAPYRDAPPRRFQDMKRELVDSFERTFLETALERAGGNVTLAAERAGVLRQVFQRMRTRHGLSGEQFRR